MEFQGEHQIYLVIQPAPCGEPTLQATHGTDDTGGHQQP